MAPRLDIAIVGAGLGGLAVAATLLRRGHRVRVAEQSPVLGEVGAGIQMSANAMKVLDRLDLRAALEPVAVRPKAFEFRRFDDGEMLHRLTLGEQHAQRHGAPYLQLHRRDLHDALRAAVHALDAQALVLGTRAVAIDECDEGAHITFDHGPRWQADLVIGADGIKSIVRQHTVGADAAVFTGQLAWRCTVPIDRIEHVLVIVIV
jgi:salicylate hydroxylase